MPAPDKFPELFQPWYPGKVIEGLYRIEGEIARGGMGVIHKATDLATNDLAVIKSLLPEVAQIKEYKKRFIREAEEWVKLGAHPNIVRAYTAHEIEYLPRIVAEYVDGLALADVLKKPPSVENALRIAVQICWGMAYAHDKGLAHRDLKPGNVMITGDGCAKVTDFGLAKMVEEDSEITGEVSLKEFQSGTAKTLLTDGTIGTPEYIAPEQWEGAGGKSSDIYAFGIMLYELFCGCRPFDYSHLEGINRITAYYRSHTRDIPPKPKDISSIPMDLPKELIQLMNECLEKSPEARPENFRKIAHLLNSVLQKTFDQELIPEPTVEELGFRGMQDQANGYLHLGNGCSFRGDYDKATDLFNKARDIFEEINDQKGMANFYRHLGIVNIHLGEYDTAMTMYGKSQKISEDINDHLGLSNCFNVMGTILLKRGDKSQALEMLQKASEICRQNNEQFTLALCYGTMGNIYYKWKNQEKALEMYEKTLEIGTRLGDQGLLSRIYMNIGLLFDRSGEYNQAINMFEKSLEKKKFLCDNAGMSSCYVNLGNVYKKLRDFKQAISMCEKSLEIAEELGDKLTIGYGYFTLGSTYFECDDLEKAEKMLQRSIEIWEAIDYQAKLGHGLYMLGIVRSKQGKTSEALNLLNESLAITKKTDDSNQTEVEEFIAKLKEQSGKE
ncbi:tetratricopeptide repeat protein [Planctomycetota bacterium]